MTKHSSISLMLLLLPPSPPLPIAHAVQIETILHKMEVVYAVVTDYRSTGGVGTASQNESLAREKFLSTFKKPKRIRLDFETPYPGMVVIYSNKDEKVQRTGTHNE